MEKITHFFKKHTLLLVGIGIGIVLAGVIFGLVINRHGPRNRGPQFQFNQEQRMMGQGKMQGREGMMNGDGMGMGGMGNPEMPGGPGEGIMQEFICQSGSLQSGFNEKVLVGIDMKINNLELIKNNIKSMVDRTNTEYPTGDVESLDTLIQRFDAQRKLLETSPESFCEKKETWEELNKDLRETMTSIVSGQVHKFEQEGKKGGFMGMKMFQRNR